MEQVHAKIWQWLPQYSKMLASHQKHSSNVSITGPSQNALVSCDSYFSISDFITGLDTAFVAFLDDTHCRPLG